MVIRHAILAHAADGMAIIQSGEFELDESYFGGRRKGNRGRGVYDAYIAGHSKK